MTRKLSFSNKNAIIIGGFLLGAYLLLMITVTNAGQNRLKESQSNELSLKVNSYSESLTYLFSSLKKDIKEAEHHKSTFTFFANLASGMSMEYGLGASLFQLKQNLVSHTKPDLKQQTQPYFNRLLMVGVNAKVNAKVIADSNPKLPFDTGSIPFKKLSQSTPTIDATFKGNLLIIRVIQPVYYNGDLVAAIVGYVNDDILTRLLTNQESVNRASRLDLATNDGVYPIWNTLDTDTTDAYEHISYSTLSFEQKVKGTPFYLHAWFEPLSEQQIITSTWFTIALSFLAVPVIFGLYYALKINNANIVLITKFAETSKKRALLTEQNSRLKTEIERRRLSEQELAYQATHDSLTGLANRKSGDEKLRQAIINAERSNQNVLILFIDLDNFKQINDTLGHSAGDKLLQQVSQRLKSAVRKTDVVARIGGDEFLMVIPNLQSQDNAKLIASNLMTVFEKPFYLDKTEFFASSSIGMAIYPQDGQTTEDLLARADIAMYRVKECGRNGFSFYDSSMNQDVQRNIDIDARLRKALSFNEFEVYYQPIIDLKKGQIVGAEALLRWTDNKLGFISPAEFIPIAEKNGLINQLGEFALMTACTQMAQWQKIRPLLVAVNVSSVQFRQHTSLLELIKRALKTSQLPANLLDIEITESLLINHNDDTLSLLNQLKEMGVQLSIDDFGTGYSALSYLQKFPFNKLKIDRSFLQDMESTLPSRELINAIIAMADALNLKVVAEGVETQWDMHYLQSKNCSFAQGFYFSKPIPAQQFEELLHKHSVDPELFI
ncbi:putative bifunctional diguanylate cyclase/phosphodiesterase [Vibrio gallicus]|uniref:putative bifunctional diguanylate cyclase/phosphodiesterase n=1 Tax=Vibrio gallicus TaxID=190897 RepID=UPI0021C442FB|nr:EAL domain-containing protein [Vibrio gallicus]